MVHFDPAWFEAGATGFLAAETGAAMLHKKDAATTPTVNVTVNTISAQDWWIGIALVVAAVLAAPLIIHHGLVA
jgi:hypothetical protein